MKRLSLPILVLALFIGVATPALANHSWANYHWARTANPFTLTVGSAVGNTWTAYLDEAISDWSASGVLDLTKVPSTLNPKTCKGTTGRIEVCNSRYGYTGWLGIAQIWISGSHITKGISKMNDTYFAMPTYNTPAWKRLVMCQEIAHNFGLGHQDENFNNANLGSCMDYTSDPDGGGAYGPSNEHPNAHDFEQLMTTYTHLDSGTTINAVVNQTAGRLVAELAQAKSGVGAEFGKAVAVDAQGRPNVFEQDLGNGVKQITHVFWVP